MILPFFTFFFKIINLTTIFHFSYPKKEVKWALAKAIVLEFPCFRDDSTFAGCVSFFNKVSKLHNRHLSFKDDWNIKLLLTIMVFAFRNTFSISKQARALSNIGFGMRENLCHLSKKNTAHRKLRQLWKKINYRLSKGLIGI